jgi:hypothetical protein
MRTIVHGHVVTSQPVDGIRDHWRIRIDGTRAGLIAQGGDDWRTLPVYQWSAPVCHAPDRDAAIVTLVAAFELVTSRRLFS